PFASTLPASPSFPTRRSSDLRCDPGPSVRVHPARHLRPPIMDAAEVSHYRAAYHDEMKMSDDEVSVVDVYVDGQGGEKEAGQSSHRKKTDEAQRIEHGGLKRNRSFI